MLSAYENIKDEMVCNSDIKEIYYGHTNNMAARRKLFNSIGPFVECQRGADTLFVRSVVEHYSCGSVAFKHKINVRHLELDSIRVYFHKVLTYASSRRKYHSLTKVRNLSVRQRLEVFRRVVTAHDYSFAQSFTLFSLLSFGMFCWMLGSLYGQWLLVRNPDTRIG